MNNVGIYVVSQIFMLNNYLFAMLTYNVRKRKTILLFNLIASTSVLIAFLLLEAYSGVAMAIVNLIRTFLFLIDEKINGRKTKMRTNDWIIFFVISGLAVACAIPTYENIWSMCSIFSTIVYSFSVCQKNMFAYRVLGIPASIGWIIYNIYVKAVVGVVLETALLIIEIIGVIRFGKETKRKRHVSRLVYRLLG